MLNSKGGLEMLKQFIVVNEEGFQVDAVLLPVDSPEITEFHVSKAYEGYFLPKWDFEAEEWSEGLSEEEVQERLTELDDLSKNLLPSIEEIVNENQKLKLQQEMLEGAVIEMAQLLF